jgi:Glycosyltransferase family 87
MKKRPPLWLAAAALASFWSAMYTLVSWVLLWHVRPIHEDVRMNYVAAEAGIRYGWASIYDQSTLRALSSGFPPDAQIIDVQKNFASAPFVAWLFAPLTIFSEPVAYFIWTVVSLAALVVGWQLAAPYKGLARWTVLFAVIGLWPVLLTLYFGQPTLVVVGLAAAAWWLCAKDRPVAGGAALALATFVKPQAVLLLPVALLLSGRYRAVLGWAGASAVLGIITILSLGPSGLIGWWHALRTIQDLPVNREYTLVHLLGAGPLTYVLWTAQGAAAMFIAWRRRAELETVFAAGVLGTVTTATYFHQADYSVLVLPAWLVLRTSPPVWQRWWLALGIIPMQLMTYGAGTTQPLLDVAYHAPQLVWDAGWLVILLRDSVGFVVDAEDAQEEAGKDRLHAEREQDRAGDHLAHGQSRV